MLAQAARRALQRTRILPAVEALPTCAVTHVTHRSRAALPLPAAVDAGPAPQRQAGSTHDDAPSTANGPQYSLAQLAATEEHMYRNALDMEHPRRLREMEAAAAAPPGLKAGPAVTAVSAERPAAKAWLPTPEQVAERLRSSAGCSASSSGRGAVPSSNSSNQGPVSILQQQQQQPQQEPALDWRQVVAAARETQAKVEGHTMLTDTFRRKHSYLRISLTERCNLRCLYCMPEAGVDLTKRSQLLSSDEIVRLAELFVAAGVDKIRLTGGEPTLRSDIVDLTRRLSALPGLTSLGITTNGIALARKLPELQAAGLTHLNISLDTLRADRFEAMTRRRGHARVLAAIGQALELGYDPVKVNVVVMRGVNDDEIGDFVEMTRHKAVNVRFIEYMPFDGNVWSDTKMVTYRQMMARVQEVHPEGLQRCHDPKGEVAKNFHFPGFKGSVSFITSMTSAFCSDCTRLRLMADGNLKVCLFGANEVSLRDALREGASNDDLRAVVSAAVDRKRAAHAGMFQLAASSNRAMVKIGG